MITSKMIAKLALAISASFLAVAQASVVTTIVIDEGTFSASAPAPTTGAAYTQWLMGQNVSYFNSFESGSNPSTVTISSTDANAPSSQLGNPSDAGDRYATSGNNFLLVESNVTFTVAAGLGLVTGFAVQLTDVADNAPNLQFIIEYLGGTTDTIDANPFSMIYPSGSSLFFGFSGNTALDAIHSVTIQSDVDGFDFFGLDSASFTVLDGINQNLPVPATPFLVLAGLAMLRRATK
jgi:hypothetical protein